MHGRCVGGAWEVHGRCTEGAQKLCGRYMEGVWKVHHCLSLVTIDCP